MLVDLQNLCIWQPCHHLQSCLVAAYPELHMCLSDIGSDSLSRPTRVLGRTCSPPSFAEVSEVNMPMSQLCLPARGPSQATDVLLQQATCWTLLGGPSLERAHQSTGA